jgi:hypothetical protein
MKRTIVILAVAALALTACGSSSTPDPKSSMLDGVRAAAISSGLTEEQADCIVDGLSDLSVEQLNAIAADTADPATEQAYTMVAAECLVAK